MKDLHEHRRRNKEESKRLHRKDEVQRIGTTSIIIKKDDSPAGHAELALRIVRGVEYNEDEAMKRTPKPSQCNKNEICADRKTTGERFEPSSSDKTAENMEISVNRQKQSIAISAHVERPKESKQPHERSISDIASEVSYSEASQEVSLDPLRNFRKTKEKLSCTPQPLLGGDTSASDDELFAEGNSSILLLATKGKDCFGGTETSTVNTGQKPRTSRSSPTSRQVRSNGLTLRDTLPRHPRPRSCENTVGTSDWGKLVMETTNQEPTENEELTSIIGEDSTVSSSSVFQRSSDGAFAQLDLEDSDGIRMISNREILDENDSTGLHRRSVFANKQPEVKRGLLSGIHTLKALGSEMILKKADSSPPPQTGTRKVANRVDRGLASMRSMSFRLNTSKPSKLIINNRCASDTSSRPSLFSSGRSCRSIFLHDDESMSSNQTP